MSKSEELVEAIIRVKQLGNELHLHDRALAVILDCAEEQKEDLQALVAALVSKVQR